MTTARKATLFLIAQDAVATLAVFNILGFYWGMLRGLLILPLLGPVGAVLLAIYLIEGYRARTNFQSPDYLAQHVVALVCALFGLLLITYGFLPAGFELQSSRAVLGLGVLVLIPETIAIRQLVAHRIDHLRRGRHLIFVGDAPSRAAFAEECRRMRVSQPILYASPRAGDPGAPRSFAETIAEIRAKRLPVEAIVLRESDWNVEAEAAQQLMDLYFAGVPTYPLELFHQVYWQKIPLYRLNPTWLFQQGFRIAREPVFRRLKRLSDMILAGLGLLFFLPIMLAAVVAILLDDRGPVLFLQNRVGRHRVLFRAVKLRTMAVRDRPGDPYTREGDARITRVGQILRRFRIDELPQLWNVLRGDMSLIGPRAEWDELVARYEAQIPCYSYRHLVKPGITGWAQVNFPYGTSVDDARRKLEYDLYYVRHFSFRLDAGIALRTIQIVLFGKGR